MGFKIWVNSYIFRILNFNLNDFIGPIIEGGDFFLFESRVAKRHSLRKKRHNFGLNKDLNVILLPKFQYST